MKDSKENILDWICSLIISSQSQNLFSQKNQIVFEIKKFLTKRGIKDYFFKYFNLKIKKLNILRLRKKVKKKVYLKLL